MLVMECRPLRKRPPAPQALPKTPKEAAPIDITGNWVSVVTEDWRWRMLIPKKGDYTSVPLSAEGRKVADMWDPSMLASDGCKAYGAAALMRVPGRLQISWENDTTLRIDTDAGQQTRRLYFRQRPKTANGTDVARKLGGRVGAHHAIRRPGRESPTRAGQARRLKGGDHQSKGRIPAQERCPLQPGHHDDGIFRSSDRIRDGLVDGIHYRRRPALFEPAIHHQHALQARAGPVQVDADALRAGIGQQVS